MNIRSGRRTIRVTHADRVVFPEVRVTKGEVVDYYRAVASRMVGHLRGPAADVGARPRDTRRRLLDTAEPGGWNVRSLPERLERVADPWRGMGRRSRALAPVRRWLERQ